MELQNSNLSELDNKRVKLKQNYSNASGVSLESCPQPRLGRSVSKKKWAAYDACKKRNETKLAQFAAQEKRKKDAAAALIKQQEADAKLKQQKEQNEKDRIKAQQEKDRLDAENKSQEIDAEIVIEKVKAKLSFFQTPSGKAVIIGTVATILIVASVIVLKKYKAKKGLSVKGGTPSPVIPA